MGSTAHLMNHTKPQCQLTFCRLNFLELAHQFLLHVEWRNWDRVIFQQAATQRTLVRTLRPMPKSLIVRLQQIKRLFAFKGVEKI